MEQRFCALIDERLVEDTLFLRRGPGMPRLLSPNPVVEKGLMLGPVLRDKNGRWTMWYTQVIPRNPKTDMVRYDMPLLIAYSQDGIQWEKPKMGIVNDPLYVNQPNAIIGPKQMGIGKNGLFELIDRYGL